MSSTIYKVNGMVEFFFHLASKWSKWCAQTLHPFSHILKIFSRISAPIVAPPSNNFRICLLYLKWFSFLEKRLQTASKSAYKHRRYLLLNNATALLATVMRRSVIYEQELNLAIANRSRVSWINTSHA